MHIAMAVARARAALTPDRMRPIRAHPEPARVARRFGVGFPDNGRLAGLGPLRAHTKLDGRRSAGSALASFASAGRVF